MKNFYRENSKIPSKNNYHITEENTSQKSWIATLLLCLLGGHIGLHRFYTGKIVTGIAFLCTVGGFGVGYIADLILIVTGKFMDKNGQTIKCSWHIKSKQTLLQTYNEQPKQIDNMVNDPFKKIKEMKQYNTSSVSNYSEITVESDIKDELQRKKEKWINGGKERLENWRKENGFYVENRKETNGEYSTEKSHSNYSEIIVTGEEEKKQSIPPKTSNIIERKTTAVPGITISISASFSSIDDDDDDFDTSYSYGDISKSMAKYENTVGKPAVFVPFMQYWPSYESMDKKQKAWYFYWRTQVRKSIYLDTDLSYIFVHVYELLSGFGWKKPQDGYNQLISLWTNYRKDFPKLDNYLNGWLFDFAQIHNLDYYVPEDVDISLPYQPVIRDLMIDEHSNDRPLKLSFELIDALCDYSLVGSKFYKDCHQLLMKEAIPRVVALADAALIKKKGKGILKIYGPSRAKKYVYYAFQSANCVKPTRPIEVSVKAYTSTPKLRNYINELVRYTENVLRELYGCRGRLRGVELDGAIATLIKDFLKKEYSPKKITHSEEPKKEVKLDFSSIAKLRTESDAVREALEVVEDTNESKELLTDLEPVKEIFSELPPYSRKLMDELKENNWEIKYDSTTQIAIEKINEISIKKLACAILVTEYEALILEDDYRDEFEYIYSNLKDFDVQSILEESSNKSLFAIDLLSEPMRQFIETLSPIQEKILYIVLEGNGSKESIEVIANEELTMPEILLDEINDIATQYIGDILIDTFGDELSVLEQYIDELKNSMKTEGK